MARTPASASTCRPSANGKYASLAATAPGRAPRPGHREPGRVHPVDLAHADPDRAPPGGEQDGVGLDAAAGAPGESQVGEDCSDAPGRLSAQCAGSSPAASIRSADWSSMPPSTWRHSAPAPGRPPAAPSWPPSRPEPRPAPAGAGRRRWRAGQQPQVLLRGQHVQRVGLEAGRDHDLGEDVRDLAGQVRRHQPVRGDHPAEGRHRVTGVRLAVRFGQVRAHRDPAGLECLMIATQGSLKSNAARQAAAAST